MNKSSSKKVGSALFIHVTCALLVLAASRTVICQETAAKLQSAPQQSSSTAPAVFTVTVTNKRGEYATGLDQSHFAVFDDKAAQEITYFKGPDEPISVGILFDVSRSMYTLGQQGLMKELFGEELSRFLERSNKANEYFLIGFNVRPQLLLDWTSNVNEIKAAAVRLSSEKPKGHATALYDACYLGVDKLNHSRHRKRALIVMSDGQDNDSHYTRKDLTQLLKESDVLLYTLGINNAMDINSPIGMQGRGILEQFALISGGAAFFPENRANLRNAFDLMADELRHQYSIGFNPANYRGDREWHRVKIKVVLPPAAPPELRHLSVRSREGYYPTMSLH